MSEKDTGQETDNQGGEETFVSSLPEDLREEPSLQDFKDVGSLAKSYVNAQKLVGRDKLPIPNDDEDELAWNEVYARLGRPDQPGDYEIAGPDPEKDDFELDDKVVESFKEQMHKLGMTPKQVQGAMDFNMDFIRTARAEAAQSMEKQYETSVAELRKELGATYDAKVNLANRALEHFGGQDAVASLEKFGLDNDPNLVRMFIKIGEEIGEDKFGEAGASISGGMPPAEARGKIAEIKTDQKFMKVYTDRYSPGHAEAVQRMQELYKQAYPS